MLIITCIIILRYWWHKYRWLSAVLVVAILFFLILLVKKVYKIIDNRNNIIETEQWVNVLDFSNILKIDKVWKLQSYPMTTILSDVDGEVVSINIVTWDIVQEYDILMQIKSVNKISSDYNNIDQMMDVMYDNYKDLDIRYREFENEYWDRIDDLEDELFNTENALIQAMELNDSEGIKILKEEIKNINSELKILKSQQEDLKFWIRNLESEINLVRWESDKYYLDLEKQTPRAPFKWVISNIYVWEWDIVKNGDILTTIINNNYTPEILVSLDFNEYVLTKDLTWVDIILENENWWNFEYSWEIYTRSPILNNEWKYTMTVRIVNDDVFDLILDDDNSKITVIFTIDSESEWFPSRCFKKIWKNKWVLTLRDWDVIVDKDAWIKNIWNNWVNIDKLELYWLEKEEEIDWIQLCVEDWNKWVIKENDVDIIDWFNQFETVEDFCAEFIKVNPMYWSGHRNLSIVSLLWWPWEKIEVLCDIE